MTPDYIEEVPACSTVDNAQRWRLFRSWSPEVIFEARGDVPKENRVNSATDSTLGKNTSL